MGHEFDRCPPSSTEIKNKWSSSSAPTTCVDKEKIIFTLFITELRFILILGEGIPVHCGQFLEEL